MAVNRCMRFEHLAHSVLVPAVLALVAAHVVCDEAVPLNDGSVVPCRRAPRPPVINNPTDLARRGFQVLADSDGITRTLSDCKTTDGYKCEMCCDGRCCEKLTGSAVFSHGQQLWVPLRFIYIGVDDPPLISLAMVNDQISSLNAAFETAGYSFHFDSYEVFNDTRMASSCNTDPCYVDLKCDFFDYTMPKVRHNSEDVVNIVLCRLPYLGESQFPWFTVEDHPWQYVQIAYSGFQGMGYEGSPHGHGKTVVHEMGHYFGLLHVFEIDGKCDVEGDYVDDTPRCSVPASASDACGYFRDSCPYAVGNDDHNNYMNYAADNCMDHFTDGQIERLQLATNLYRPIFVSRHMVNGSCSPASSGNLSLCNCTDPSLDPTDFCRRRVTATTTTATTTTTTTATTATAVTSGSTDPSDSEETTTTPDHTSAKRDTTPTWLLVVVIAIAVVGTGFGCGAFFHSGKWKRKPPGEGAANVPDVVSYEIGTATPPPGSGTEDKPQQQQEGTTAAAAAPQELASITTAAPQSQQQPPQQPQGHGVPCEAQVYSEEFAQDQQPK